MSTIADAEHVSGGQLSGYLESVRTWLQATRAGTAIVAAPAREDGKATEGRKRYYCTTSPAAACVCRNLSEYFSYSCRNVSFMSIARPCTYACSMFAR